jgi:hypothetical protein
VVMYAMVRYDCTVHWMVVLGVGTREAWSGMTSTPDESQVVLATPLCHRSPIWGAGETGPGVLDGSTAGRWVLLRHS